MFSLYITESFVLTIVFCKDPTKLSTDKSLKMDNLFIPPFKVDNIEADSSCLELLRKGVALVSMVYGVIQPELRKSHVREYTSEIEVFPV